MMNKSFWQGKKVFITGHTGFKGSWLSLWLQQWGAELKGFSLEPPTPSNLFTEAHVASKMESEIGDVRDYEALCQSIRAFEPDIIFHLAAQPLVRLSYDIPVETYATNVMGTIHLFEAARQVGSAKAIVNITSDKCYENKEWPWGYRENESLGGYDPYSSSKGCAELITSAYRNTYFNKDHYTLHHCAIASVRAGNVIGGGDWATDRLVPDILKSFQRQEAVCIRNPEAIRPWQHVLEPLSGYIILAEHLFTGGMKFAEAWNFGPDENDAKPVRWIVKKLIENWGNGAQWIEKKNDQLHEAHFLKLDCSKAKMLLNWYPRWDLELTLQKIVKWHKAWLHKDDMRAYTLNEINEYLATGVEVQS